MQQKKETRRPFIEHWQVIKAMLVIYGACPKMSVNKNPMVAN